MNTQEASPLTSSPSSSSSRRCIYDVFLSFRGMDTRNTFTDHLYAALQRSGIYTFRDNERLERGKSISPELLEAIEKSKISIVILSRNYASSTWCLDELTKIIQCMKVMGMTVLPIFYYVNPSDVRKQRGTFAQAFAEHEERLKDNIEKVQTWRATLSEVANLSGWHSQDRLETEVIEDIVKVILNKLSSTCLVDTKGLVGIASKVEKLMSHLAMESNSVRIIGIWGIGGIGKTTLARAVYSMISNQFEACCFIDNVRDVYKKCGILQLQQKLLEDLLIFRDMNVKMESNSVRIIGIWGIGGIGKTTLARAVYSMISNQFEACCFIDNVRDVYKKCGILQLQQKLLEDLLIFRDMNVKDVNNGVLMIKNRLRHKKILLILDDVNELDQLNKLVVEHNCFGLGSRVIITTRDVHLLITCKVDQIYEIEGLSYDEAFHLFNSKAFGKEHPPEEYLELSKAYVDYANGLPLAVQVLGSFMFNKSTHEWKSELGRLKEFPEKEISNVLQISFDGLKEIEKEIFLHIACFFNHNSSESTIAILDCLDLYPEIGLRVLYDKSLIKLQYNQLWMHDLLQEMGRDIVRKECPKDPGKRSRLWLHKDIDNVLTKNTGTEAIQGIVLMSLRLKGAHWNPSSFSKMLHLKFLIIKDFHYDPKHLPNELRFLHWSGYASKSLPTSFQPNELIELHMCYSNIERLWKGTKSCEMLKFIELKGSLKLFETPDFTEIPILEKLVLEDCKNLRDIHPSIAVHKKLTLLNLKGCKNLKSLTRKFEIESLEILILSNCSKLKTIPEFGENMGRVTELYLDGTAITKLPMSIENLSGLVSLDARDCKNLMSLPSTFFRLRCLKDLNLSGCSKLQENLGCGESFDVNGQMSSSNAMFETLKKIAFGGFRLLPFYPLSRSSDSMGSLSSSLFDLPSLSKLNLSYCNLKEIPDDIGHLFSLKCLLLRGNNFGCLPESIAQLSNLKTLIVDNCTRLQSFPTLPLNIGYVEGFNCSSLETVPDLLRPNSSFEPKLLLSNCSKLTGNQGFIDLFFAVIKKSPQGLSPNYHGEKYDVVFPGSKMLEWFSHQCTGNEVNIMEPFSLFCNDWIGIAVCVVFCSPLHHQFDNDPVFFKLKVNGKDISFANIKGRVSTYIIDQNMVALSDHIWLLYLLPQHIWDEDRKSLWECDANGFREIGIKIYNTISSLVKKCGLRVVYKKDIEDLNGNVVQCSNNSIIPYEGLKESPNLWPMVNIVRSQVSPRNAVKS